MQKEVEGKQEMATGQIMPRTDVPQGGVKSYFQRYGQCVGNDESTYVQHACMAKPQGDHGEPDHLTTIKKQVLPPVLVNVSR
jgi:hypothetical protein